MNGQLPRYLARIPWSICLCVFLLMSAGLAGIARGDALSGASGYFHKQAVWIALGIPLMFAATLVPYRRLREYSVLLFLVSLVGLVVVYFMPATGGSRRWIPLGFFKLQPSELTKIAYIFALAHYLMYRDNYRRLFGLIVPFVLTLVPVLLILREPDLGTSLLFFPVLFAMLFSAGAKAWHLVLIICLGILTAPVLWLGMSAEQRSRIVTVFQQQDGGPAPRGDGYHLHQSKQVLALGGVWGSDVAGMSHTEPAAYHLPAARTDFVYCLVGERWGLWGTCGILGIYLFLIGRGLAVAGATREPFGRLVAVGIVTLIASQATINTGMTVGLMPITGMTLPLMSYGGSSLLSTCLAIGLLMNIAMRPGYEVTGEPFRFVNGNRVG